MQEAPLELGPYAAQISLRRGAEPARILFLDDVQPVRESLITMLRFCFTDFVPIECTTGDEAWLEISSRQPDLLISDVHHPGLPLEDLLFRLAGRQSSCPVIVHSAVISGYTDLLKRILSLTGLRVTILHKPTTFEELRARIIASMWPPMHPVAKNNG